MTKALRQDYGKCIWIAAAVFLFSIFLCSAPVNAGEKEEVTVRVGWYQSALFQEGMSDEVEKSGYCYDYLQKVADYTSWRYEYVYGNWTELLDLLEKGEIDLLAGVSVSDERKALMNFPDSAMGNDQYYLYKRANDDSIEVGNPESLNGKTVGGIVNNHMTLFTEQWIEENNIDLEVVYYDSFEEQYKAFNAGEIDLVTQTLNNVSDSNGIASVSKVGEEPFYLAVAKNRTDLLKELNMALNTMLSIDPFILMNLQYQNYGATLISKTLSGEELNWLLEHPTIVVGYLNDYLPYSDTDEEGNTTGLVVDTMAAVFGSLNLAKRPEIQYVAYMNYDDMVSAVRSGEVDLAFPVYGGLWALEQDQINATTAVVSGGGTFFYKGVVGREEVTRVAVDKNNSLQKAYTHKEFPQATIVLCDSVDACLNAVLRGQADGTVMDALRTQYVTGNNRYNSLSYIQLNRDDSKSFGLSEENTELLLLMNRGLRIIGSSYGLDNSYRYMGSFYTYGAEEFLRDNMMKISIAVGIFVFLIILAMGISLRRRSRVMEEQESYIHQINRFNAELEQLRVEADAANAAKTAFLFNMSHDIRTPMNAILGYGALMEKELDQPNRLKEHLSKIRNSGEYLLNLINNLLEVARIDSGKVIIEETYVDLTDDSCSVIPLLENEIKKKNIDFTAEMAIEHKYVLADMHKIREITMNLMSNAIKYTPEGGSIHMSFRELPCEREGYATYVNAIEDTGIGMSEEFLEHIFESFTRERTTTESKVGGTGLGMSIVKQLVDLMGGRITVESELGKGTRFEVIMDHKIVENVEEYLEKTQEVIAGEEIDLTNKRILMAEDNEFNAEIAQMVLEEAGALVDVAEDGVECLNMILEHEGGYYDAILMDVQMPNLNGYDTTRSIRKLQDPQKAGIIIIALTANAFEEDKQNALDAGMNGHLSKPIVIPELIETLSKALH